MQKFQPYKISLGSKIFLVLLWVATIGGIILFAQSVPIPEQAGLAFTLKIGGMLFGAFVLTIIGLVPGNIWRRVKLTLAVVIGSLWASSIALFVLGMEAGYERVVLLPICQSYQPSEVSFKEADLHLPSNEHFWWSSGYLGTECISEKSRTELSSLTGASFELLLSSLGALFTIGGALLLWGGSTYLLVRWFIKIVRPLNCRTS